MLIEWPLRIAGGDRTSNARVGGVKERKSLKNMEPMSGIEPLTYALRMLKRMKRKVIDVAVVAETAAVYETVGPSIQFPFVYPEPNTPDP